MGMQGYNEKSVGLESTLDLILVKRFSLLTLNCFAFCF